MPIMLKSLLTEDPDDVKINKPPYKYSWHTEYTKPFFTNPYYSLVRSHGTHGDILQTIDNVHRIIFKMDEKVVLPVVKRKFEEGGVTCSDLNEFVDDYYHGTLGKFIKMHSVRPNSNPDDEDSYSPWHFATSDYKALKHYLSGRVWPEHNIMSFWNKLADIKQDWKQIKDMFAHNEGMKYNLDDYMVDNLERDRISFDTGRVPDLVPAKGIEHHGEEEVELSPEEIRDLQKKLHTLPPAEKKRAMLKLGMVNVNNKARDVKADYYQDAIAEGKIF
jgi:hypothetical protein